MNEEAPGDTRIQLLDALLAVRGGDFSVRLLHDWPGVDGKIADAVNGIVDTHAQLARAIARVSTAVGLDGRLGQRLHLDHSGGAWAAQEVHEAQPGAEPPLLLIIEDDPVFARSLQNLARERGFHTMVAGTGGEGLELAARHHPAAVTLDLELPDVDGWDVADRLRADPATSAIPVHVISVRDRPHREARHGVASYTTKPADLGTLGQVFAGVTAGVKLPLRVLLLIESDPARREAIQAALAGPDRSFDTVASGAEALALLRRGSYSGIVIEVDLPDEDGIALLERIRAEPGLVPVPAVLYAERSLTEEEMARVARLETAVVGDARRPLNGETAEVAEFLLRVRHGMPPVAEPDVLAGKLVMIVDDDPRNLFALTGLLESHGLRVEAVDSGEAALRRLQEAADIDLVLMDIMMPDIDGYEATRRIRADPRLARLPVIALTAKAMLEDRERCLAAGASDYATKPVDSAQLLAQLRLWLGRARNV